MPKNLAQSRRSMNKSPSVRKSAVVVTCGWSTSVLVRTLPPMSLRGHLHPISPSFTLRSLLLSCLHSLDKQGPVRTHPKSHSWGREVSALRPDLLKVFPGGSLAADQGLLRGTFTICNKVGPCPPTSVATGATEGAVGGPGAKPRLRLTREWVDPGIPAGALWSE